MPSRNMPPHTARKPHPRHRLARVTQTTTAKPMNSVIEPWVDINEDVAAINRGEAQRQGETYTVHGRTYRLKPSGTLYPVSGVGIHPLRRGAFNALGVYNQFGLSPRAEELLDTMKVNKSERDAARIAWQAGRNKD